MKLNPGERSILAYFKSSEGALAAKEELKRAGYSETQLDRVGEYGYNPDMDLEQVGRGSVSLSAATLDTRLRDDDVRILMAATPEASGLSGPPTTLTDSTPFLLTIVTDEQGVDEAVRICEQHEGRV